MSEITKIQLKTKITDNIATPLSSINLDKGEPLFDSTTNRLIIGTADGQPASSSAIIGGDTDWLTTFELKTMSSFADVTEPEGEKHAYKYTDEDGNITYPIYHHKSGNSTVQTGYLKHGCIYFGTSGRHPQAAWTWDSVSGEFKKISAMPTGWITDANIYTVKAGSGIESNVYSIAESNVIFRDSDRPSGAGTLSFEDFGVYTMYISGNYYLYRYLTNTFIYQEPIDTAAIYGVASKSYVKTKEPDKEAVWRYIPAESIVRFRNYADSEKTTYGYIDYFQELGGYYIELEKNTSDPTLYLNSISEVKPDTHRSSTTFSSDGESPIAIKSNADGNTITFTHSKPNSLTEKSSYTDISTNASGSVNIVTPKYDTYGHVTGTTTQKLTISTASESSLGLIKVGGSDTSNAHGDVASYQPVKLDKNKVAFVDVPNPSIYLLPLDVEELPLISSGKCHMPQGTYVNNQALTTIKSVTLNKNDICIKRITIHSDKVEYTSYIYNGANWQAMDGNYDANNVYFSENVTVTTTVGNITTSNNTPKTLEFAGKNLKQVYEYLYAREDVQIAVTGTSASIKLSKDSDSLEVGSPYTLPTASVSTGSGGYYEYGGKDANGTKISKDTNLTDVKFNLTLTYKRPSASAVTIASGTNVTSITSTEVPEDKRPATMIATDDSITHKFNGTFTNTASAFKPITNLGNFVTAINSASAKSTSDYTSGAAGIPPRTTAQSMDEQTYTVYGFRRWYYGGDNESDFSPAIIKGLTQSSDAVYADTFELKAADYPGCSRIVIAIPEASNIKVSEVLLKSASNANITSQFIQVTDEVIKVGGVNDYDPKVYNVWQYKPNKLDSTEVYTITIS